MRNRWRLLMRAPEKKSGEQVFRLKSSDVQILPRAVRSVTVLSGDAWLAVNRQNIILHNGQSIVLSTGMYPAVITPLVQTTLTFRVES
jgi:hypothetical protein